MEARTKNRLLLLVYVAIALAWGLLAFFAWDGFPRWIGLALVLGWLLVGWRNYRRGDV